MGRKIAAIVAVLVLVVSIAGCNTGPMQSSEGNVKVTLPTRGETVTFVKQSDGSWKGTIRTTGMARAFEATVSWQVTRPTNGSSSVSLGQGSFMTSAGAPDFGTFDQTLVLTSPASQPVPAGNATLRIFIASMKDGSQQDIVDVLLMLHAEQ
ncbi:MAG: Gmad2 immunoglobulin-like domain-containing protein [Candidatus Cryosericum sp.]